MRGGYDGANTSYDAFCDGSIIVVNLYTYLASRKGREGTPEALAHDLVCTVTHELAHLLARRLKHCPQQHKMLPPKTMRKKNRQKLNIYFAKSAQKLND